MITYKDISKELKILLLETFAKTIKGLPNYGNVSKGLSRSGQPNEVGLEHLKQLGIDVIIKLDREEEYSLNNEKELFGGRVIAKPLNLNTITKADGLRIASIIDQELKKGNRVHVHCKYGRDRTGLVIGTWQLKYNNTSFSQIKTNWKSYGKPRGKVSTILEEISNSLK